MKFFKLIPLVFLIKIICAEEDKCFCGKANDEEHSSARRIVNGQPVNIPNKYPWIAGLVFITSGDRLINGCTGSVISDQNIITSANCFYYPGHAISILKKSFWLLGMHELGQGTRYNTKEYFLHPKFSYFLRPDEADLVIATLDRKITFGRTIKPICLPSLGDTFIDTVAVVAGWGFTAYDGTQPDALMETQMDIIPTTECSKRWHAKAGRSVKISEKWMVCAHRAGTDTCKADSGAPLMTQSNEGFYQLIGTDSFGLKCDAIVPAVFSRLSHPETLNWITGYLKHINATTCYKESEMSMNGKEDEERKLRELEESIRKEKEQEKSENKPKLVFLWPNPNRSL